MTQFTDAMRKTSVIGRSLTRLEDEVLLRGQGRFTDDINLPQQLHMRVVRAQIAHGRMKSVDCTAALDVPGVVAVWTGEDVAHLPPIDFRDPAAEILKPFRQPVLAQNTVRYVGEPVAAVFAHDPYTAEDAAALVVVELEAAPALLSARAEPGEFAPAVSTEAVVLRDRYGEPDASLSGADQIMEIEIGIGRHSGVP